MESSNRVFFSFRSATKGFQLKGSCLYIITESFINDHKNIEKTIEIHSFSKKNQVFNVDYRFN